jgi:hypothetical protein
MSGANFFVDLSGTVQRRFIQHCKIRVKTRVHPLNPIENAPSNLNRRKLACAKLRRQILQR